MRKTMWACVTLLLLAPIPAFAGHGARGDWELGAYGGHEWLDDYGPFKLKDDLFYGGRLGYFITRHFGLEASAQRLATETSGLPSRDVDLTSYRGNAIFNLLAGVPFQPFLTAGLGAEKTDIAGFSNESKMGWNAGGGFRVYLMRAVALRLDGRYSQVHLEALNENAHNVEASAGLSLLFGGREGEGQGEERHEMPQPSNQPPTVSVVCDHPEVLPGETVNVTATGSDPEGRPLTYTWSSSEGHIEGNGSTATLTMDGVTAPSNATVTVRAMDDHGLSSAAECSVRLVEAAKPAEAVSCMAGGFPRNLSRITNVDKACLDDVASRLRDDPRAHVVVVGYADSHERSAQRIGSERADAVKDYLVQAGADGSRITTRSGGSSKPLDTGTDMTTQSRNRRVEVWFVPEGAREPDQQ